MVKSNFVCYEEDFEFESSELELQARLLVGDVVNLEEFVNPVTKQRFNSSDDFVVSQVRFDLVTFVFTYVLKRM